MTQPADNLATEGATIVRGLLAPDDAANLRRTVDEIYAVMDSCERFPNKLLGEQFPRLGRRMAQGVAGIPAPSAAGSCRAL